VVVDGSGTCKADHSTGVGTGVNHAEFKKKRMQHYNEWKRLQEFRKRYELSC
jgi:hypothetical protein